jgi:hypothetical protein
MQSSGSLGTLETAFFEAFLLLESGEIAHEETTTPPNSVMSRKMLKERLKKNLTALDSP